MVHEAVQVLFHHTVKHLDLAVTLGVIGRAHTQFSVVDLE